MFRSPPCFEFYSKLTSPPTNLSILGLTSYQMIQSLFYRTFIVLSCVIFTISLAAMGNAKDVTVEVQKTSNGAPGKSALVCFIFEFSDKYYEVSVMIWLLSSTFICLYFDCLCKLHHELTHELSFIFINLKRATSHSNSIQQISITCNSLH